MDILTQTISLLFRHRQTEIGRFGQDIDHIQRKQLHALLSTARKTEWGLKYDYKSIRSYSDFCQRLPLQTYDEIKPYVTRMINGERNILWPSVVRWYAKSSGTTNDKSPLPARKILSPGNQGFPSITSRKRCRYLPQNHRSLPGESDLRRLLGYELWSLPGRYSKHETAPGTV